jgi:hypothetical protein
VPRQRQHSIGNNLKRIVIVVTSVIIFGQKMSTQVSRARPKARESRLRALERKESFGRAGAKKVERA